MATALLDKGYQEKTYLVDLRCPLFRERYSSAEARREAKGSGARWRALYGQESIEAGILLAESREKKTYLRGEKAFPLLSRDYSLRNLARSARTAANLYFSDPAAIEANKRIYDPLKNRFFSAAEIQKHLLASLKPLGQDVSAYLYSGEGYPRLSLDSRVGPEVLLPLGTPLLFLGPYKYDDEEILLHPDSRLDSRRFVYPSLFKDKMRAKVTMNEEGPIFSLHEL